MVSSPRCAVYARYSSAELDDRRQQEAAEVQVVFNAGARDQLPGHDDRNAK